MTLGKPADWPTYGWDNEYGSRTFHVRQFKASKALVRWVRSTPRPQFALSL